MKNFENVSFEESKISKVSINIECETIEEYAVSFLKIFNTVKYHKPFIKVTNQDNSNVVHIYYYSEYINQVKDYLSQFGKVVCEESALLLEVDL